MEGLDSTLTLTPSSPHPPSSPVTPHSPTTSPILPLQDITPTNNHIVTAPTQSTPITVATATLPHRPIIISSKTGGTQQSVGSSTSSAQRRWRKRISWAGVFVMPRIMSKKKSMARYIVHYTIHYNSNLMLYDYIYRRLTMIDIPCYD